MKVLFFALLVAVCFAQVVEPVNPEPVEEKMPGWKYVLELFRGFFFGHELSKEFMFTCLGDEMAAPLAQLTKQFQDLEEINLFCMIEIVNGMMDVVRASKDVHSQYLDCVLGPFKVFEFIDNVSRFYKYPDEWYVYVLINAVNAQDAIKYAVGYAYANIANNAHPFDIGQAFGEMMVLIMKQFIIFA
jgi:hypothetical protein